MYPMADITAREEKGSVEDYISSAKNLVFFRHKFLIFFLG
jgi:hypothetical protein